MNSNFVNFVRYVSSVSRARLMSTRIVPLSSYLLRS